MDLEHVRLASKTLGPLLRQRGTTPAVGASLRRAIQALDRVLVETHVPKQAEAIRLATSELLNCMRQAQQSDRLADREQLEGVRSAFSLLASLEAPVSPTAIVAPEPKPPTVAGPPKPLAPFKLGPQPAPPKQPVRPVKPRPSGTDLSTVRVRLAGLLKRIRVLAVMISEPLTSFRDLNNTHAELDKVVQAVKWLGMKHMPAFLEVAAEESGRQEEQLVALSALDHLGVAGGTEQIVAWLEMSAQKLPAVTATVLRTLASPDLLAGLLKVFLKPADDSLCGLLLPVLAESGLLATDQLWNLSNHPNADLAIQAAEALAWSGENRDAAMLLARARNTPAITKANALLFSAVALGSTEALAEVRGRLLECGDTGHHLVASLALAGDDSDAARLLAHAAQPAADVAHTLLAAANLGCAEILPALPGFANRVPSNILKAAEHKISGDRPAHTSGAMPSRSNMRMLFGMPWSVSGVIARLAAPGETIESQQRLALELRVRTGLIPPGRFPLLTSVATRAGLVASWNAHFASANRNLKPGGWYYQGRPARKGGDIR